MIAIFNQSLFFGIHCLHQLAVEFQKRSQTLSGYINDFRDVTNSVFRHTWWELIHPNNQFNYFSTTVDFWKKSNLLFLQLFMNPNEECETKISSTKKTDKRFRSADWNANPFYHFLYRQHQLKEETFIQLIQFSSIPEKHKKKIEFYGKFFIDAIAPSNFLFTNPEAIRMAIDSGGASLLKGIANFLHDAKRRDITQTDENAFQPGKNLAFTSGKVVFQNKLIQLIEYASQSTECFEIPLLIIPPWINKYYILDLQSHNSFVGFLLKSGHRVFIVSWKNPSHDQADTTFDEYLRDGSLIALDTVKKITGAERVNTLGFCLGGTLLGVTAAWLAKQEVKISINSICLLAAMIDFSDIGPMGAAIDQALIKKIERGELLINHGLLHGRYMEIAFNLIRANDLIWYYVVNNYLEGKNPKAFDVLFWTNDNTNLPAGMYVYYMKKMILENKLSRKNELTLNGVPIDVSLISSPSFIVGFCEDHISPAKTVFETLHLFGGEKQFVLGMSGHVMGVVNPPGVGKYGYYKNGSDTSSLENWRKSAEFVNDSWWKAYAEFLKIQSGKKVKPPLQPGSDTYPNLEDAPGSYVFEKCGELPYF